MNAEKKANQITEKIRGLQADKSRVVADYRTHDYSVQAELRLWSDWSIAVPVDDINYPRDLSGTNRELWDEMNAITYKIIQTKRMKSGSSHSTIPINARTKTGLERRAAAKNLWLIESGNAFLSDYRQATSNRSLAAIRKTIAALQAQQKALLPKLREANSLYLAGKKSARAEQNAKNVEALKTGHFWEADREAIKNYFCPPFEKNYLADVSAKWRAALFLECESVSYKGYAGDWRHKLSGTGNAYLCGIDDNGDEWGHRCRVDLSHDDYGNGGFDATIEEAMADLFDIRREKLADCQRQGDLLFYPIKIRHEDGPEMHPAEGDTWEPRESHQITSQGLMRNGRYFSSSEPIHITHTSHATLVLPPGEYRLYALEVAGAD